MTASKKVSKIAIVIPAYNEGPIINSIVGNLRKLLTNREFEFEIVVVDDGSRDRTEEIARNFSAIKCEWAPNQRNLGLFPNHNSALRFCVTARN